MREVVLVIHNVRSANNVGAMLRTADGLGVAKVLLTGISPYPTGSKNDERPPHTAAKVDRKIAKTALGAERSVKWRWSAEVGKVIKQLKADGFILVALEQTPQAIDLRTYQPGAKVALIVGREVGGIETEVLKLTDCQLMIPMHGQKESFNVAVAAGIALYVLTSSG